MKSALHWFEIPVRDLERAVHCYQTLLGKEIRRDLSGEFPRGLFPYEAPGIGGALIQDPKREPGVGARIYLDASDELDAVLSRAEAAKTKVILPKTSIGKNGFIGILMDTEGNAVGFHSYT
jgi:predicted enzyme related to lactoylglutathione lyase